MMEGERQIFAQEKRQKILVFVFFGILIITFLFLYFGYFKEEKEPQQLTFEFLPQKISLNFKIFQNPIFEQLQPLDPPLFPSQEEVGKEDIFKWE